jgi:DNA-binding CsgD family transcriptional regulator
MSFLEGEVLRAQAWTAWLDGQPEQARTVLRAAVEFTREQGTIALTLASLHDLARLGSAADVAKEVAVVGAAADGDLAAARVQFVDALARRDPDDLDESAARFEAMGALIYAAEASAHAAAAHVQRQSRRRSAQSERNASRVLEQCDRARTPALSALGRSSDLTTRQLEIAHLAATGLSSKSIAQRLGLSARTVDNHLQRVYQRLGVSSRDDLADALTDDPSLAPA